MIGLILGVLNWIIYWYLSEKIYLGVGCEIGLKRG